MSWLIDYLWGKRKNVEILCLVNCCLISLRARVTERIVKYVFGLKRSTPNNITILSNNSKLFICVLKWIEEDGVSQHCDGCFVLTVLTVLKRFVKFNSAVSLCAHTSLAINMVKSGMPQTSKRSLLHREYEPLVLTMCAPLIARIWEQDIQPCSILASSYLANVSYRRYCERITKLAPAPE